MVAHPRPMMGGFGMPMGGMGMGCMGMGGMRMGGMGGSYKKLKGYSGSRGV
jgi:hypothetical protein